MPTFVVDPAFGQEAPPEIAALAGAEILTAAKSATTVVSATKLFFTWTPLLDESNIPKFLGINRSFSATLLGVHLEVAKRPAPLRKPAPWFEATEKLLLL